MSEEIKTEVPAGQTTQPAATISSEAAERFQAEAMERAVEKAAEVATQKANEVIAAQNDRLRRAMGDEPADDGQKTALLKRFFEDPSGVLSVPYVRGKEEGAREAVQQIRAERAAEKANERATHEVLSVRPDIYTNPEAMSLVSTYWAQEDKDLNPTEQLKKAVKKFDLLLEKSGAGDAEKRVAQAAALSSKASTNSASSTPGGSYEDRTSASHSKWQEQRIEDFKKKHGGQLPTMTRR